MIFVLFYYILLSLRSQFFSNERQKVTGVDSDGRAGRKELGGVEGRETAVRIYEKIHFQ